MFLWPFDVVVYFDSGGVPPRSYRAVNLSPTSRMRLLSFRFAAGLFGIPSLYVQVDGEVNALLMRLPNLLDSRVPDGDGEEANVIVAEWGQEYINRGEVRSQLWYA